MHRRDLAGYRGRPPHPHWPDEARLAVSVVVNIEEGAELSLADGDERNETTHEIVEDLQGAPNLCMESHFEYGSRVGYWRIMELLARYEVPATLNTCARALERTPWVAEDALARGHEIACHGYRWEEQARMDEDAERAMIHKAVASIREVAGVRPLGWHTRSSSSLNTRRLLVEEGGFVYDSNAYNDDLPYVVEVAGKSHIVVPYSFDTNDMRFQAGRGFEHAEDFSRYCVEAADWLWREGTSSPKMMTVGLHTRIIGRPGRIGGLERFLRHLRERGGVWFARRVDIARHWGRLQGLDLPAAADGG